MSLMNILEIAGSAMSAQSIRLNSIASNLANAENTGSSPAETYHAKVPVFKAMLNDEADLFAENSFLTVRVKEVVQSNEPLKMEYRPEHPQANADGMIYKTNVNPMTELADMISASRSFQMNVDVGDAAKQMLMRTLNMGNN